MIPTEATRATTESRHITGLHLWLASMRSTDGFGGPVSHWWRNSLFFAGTGLDWRYEGIILGYLALFERTGNDLWLRLAQQAGDDLVAGQTSSANFASSSFEMNPYAGGSPGEAAADIALLALAQVLKAHDDYTWERYFLTAERNLRDHQIARLWDHDAQLFSDSLDHATFVPNKAATLIEALFRHASVSGREDWIECYVLPTLQAILRHQLGSGPLAGAIYQYGHGGQPVDWFFPYYVARCVPALRAAFDFTGDERYRDAALMAVSFIMRVRYDDGSFPQVIYSPSRSNRYPQWIAGTGDILRAISVANALGGGFDAEPTIAWLNSGMQANGSIRTAHGFAAQHNQKLRSGLPEFRDVMPVCGWADKAFRYWAESLKPGSLIPVSVPTASIEHACMLRDTECIYRESDQAIELWRGKTLLYRWQKGSMWAEVNSPDLWWK